MWIMTSALVPLQPISAQHSLNRNGGLGGAARRRRSSSPRALRGVQLRGLRGGDPEAALRLPQTGRFGPFPPVPRERARGLLPPLAEC